MIVSIVAATCRAIAGDILGRDAEDVLRAQVTRRLVSTGRLTSDTLFAYMNIVNGATQLIAEIVKDRIVGYPEAGWEEDEFVPFFDRETNSSKYPLKSPPLAMDWSMERNINSTNFDEHLPGRDEPTQFDLATFASSLPSYFMQGTCDPYESNVSALSYYDNCTRANNDIQTGGVVPTPTSKGLYEKAADLGLLMKPIYEATPGLSFMGVYFHNSGAGSMVHYPGIAMGSHDSYISEGCDWMR